MYLIDQRTKKIMEECKERARAAGLSFYNETLEYIVTNRDLLFLSPKLMIPTLYDYWVQDVEVLQEVGKYKLYPTNPYETVINSRPAISFYNDNNPDWLNIMIFYHVIAHIDFFQNNQYFQNTWNDDFVGVALADKRLIESLRNKYGRWLDYVIEFARSIDNITGFYPELLNTNYPELKSSKNRVDYYFNVFLQEELKVSPIEINKQKDKYNEFLNNFNEMGESLFFSEVKNKYPEFEAYYEKYQGENNRSDDLLQFIRDNSPFLRQKTNAWMKQVLTIIRNTSLYFAPQIRTKIMNEGWASYWHDKLFISDDRIKGHEVDYARINAGVTSLNRIGLNPYAIGLRLFQYIEELADKGKMSIEYQRLTNYEERANFDKKTNKGLETIFEVRKKFNDFTFVNTFIDQDFVERHNLFVVGKRFNEKENVIEYYVKSRKAKDYKEMIIDNLYHPPYIYVDEDKTNDKMLYLKHRFEGKPLVKEFIPEVLIGLEYLWGGEVRLETTEVVRTINKQDNTTVIKSQRLVLYKCKDRKVTKEEIKN